MKRLFLLSMAFLGVVVAFSMALGSLIEQLTPSAYYEHTHWGIAILDIFVVIIAGAGIITLGVMLAKHIIGLIKK